MKHSLLIFAFVFPALFCQAQKGTIKVRKQKLDTVFVANEKAEQPGVGCVLAIAGLPSGSEIPLDSFLTSNGPEYWDTTICSLAIEKYYVQIEHNSKTKKMLNDGQSFTKDTKEFLKQLKPGDIVAFTRIYYLRIRGMLPYPGSATFYIKK